MWRSKKFIIIALLTVVVLMGSVMGASCGSSEDAEEASPGDFQGGGPGGGMSPGMGLSDDVLVRVAEILNIDQEEMVNAFEQAQSEMMEDMPEDGQPPEGMSPEDMPSEGVPPEDMPEDGQPQGGMSPGMGLPDELLTRVAEILGIDQQELADAIEQAQSEMVDETTPPSSSQ